MGNEAPSTPTVEKIPVTAKPTVAAEQTSEQLAAKAAARAARDKRIQWLIIGGVLLIVLAIVGAVVLMANHPQATEITRDIAIVFVAVETFVIGLVMILLLFQVQALIRVLQDEIEPLLHSVNDTASTVRGTTDFVSQSVVSPIIKLAGFTAAAHQVTRNVTSVLGGLRSQAHPKGGKGNGRSE